MDANCDCTRPNSYRHLPSSIPLLDNIRCLAYPIAVFWQERIVPAVWITRNRIETLSLSPSSCVIIEMDAQTSRKLSRDARITARPRGAHQYLTAREAPTVPIPTSPKFSCTDCFTAENTCPELTCLRMSSCIAASWSTTHSKYRFLNRTIVVSELVQHNLQGTLRELIYWSGAFRD